MRTQLRSGKVFSSGRKFCGISKLADLSHDTPQDLRETIARSRHQDGASWREKIFSRPPASSQLGVAITVAASAIYRLRDSECLIACATRRIFGVNSRRKTNPTPCSLTITWVQTAITCAV